LERSFGTAAGELNEAAAFVEGVPVEFARLG